MIVVLVVLSAVILTTGCTDSAPASTSSDQSAVITTTPSITPLYMAGDIVRSPKGTAETGWLILNYDAGTDSYERAFIYRNTDGTWGYRVDSRSEKSSRPGLEKVNTVKVTHVDSALVPQTKPSTPKSTVTGASTVTTTSATVTTTVTATSTLKPKITDITPADGLVGTSVKITDLLGKEFQGGASVMLVRSGSDNISATNVNVVSPAHIMCTFTLPASAAIGFWDLMVVNPDGQSYLYQNGFTVRVNPNAVTTTTTTSTSGGIGITSIDPTSTYAPDYKPVMIYGSNFKDGIKCKLTSNSGFAEIISDPTPFRTSETQMQCFLTIPQGMSGSWNLVLTNTDGTTGNLPNAFSIY
ncbi:MAG: IPT/TIG domain-containing protein [Methanomicrobiales archaeon]